MAAGWGHWYPPTLLLSYSWATEEQRLSVSTAYARSKNAATLIPVRGDVKVEKVAYLNLPNCYKLSNGTVELIVTTDVGPRINRYSFPGEDNILAEMPDAVVKTELGDWKPLCGHRLWSAH